MVWTKAKGQGIRVAVIDTGIDPSHPAIYRNYKGGINILARNFPPMDYNGHGTHVAGIVAGRSRNAGLIGVAPWASLYAVKAFNKNGSANLSDLLSAINWCIDKKMHIINMSFGMEMVSESLKKAIMVAHQRKIVMVAATGNQGLRNSIDFPARFPETIAVTSIGMNNRISAFGNRGKGVDIAAPGEKIPSAWLGKTTKQMSGTSMAVPHVSGTIALMLQINPYLNPEQIRYLLLYTGGRIEREFIRCVNTQQAIRYLAKSQH
jgi:subtilisin